MLKITVEGPTGSGKGTILNLIREELLKQGYMATSNQYVAADIEAIFVMKAVPDGLQR